MIYSLSKENVEEIVCFQKEEAFFDGWNKNQFESSFKRGNFYVFGLKEKNKLIAFISVSTAIDSADIEDILVCKNFRRQGIGKRLIDFTLETLKEKGIREIFIEVREGNEQAKQLYFKCGFNKVSLRKKYYSDGENAIILKKEI